MSGSSEWYVARLEGRFIPHVTLGLLPWSLGNPVTGKTSRDGTSAMMNHTEF